MRIAAQVLDRSPVVRWNTALQRWTLQAGTYTVQVGDSSRSLPLSTTFTVAHTTGVRM